MADLGGFGKETGALMNPFGALGDKVRTQFRVKLVLTAVGAVLVTVILSTGIGLWNLRQLRESASLEVQKGLNKGSSDFLKKYIEATSKHVELLIGGSFTQLQTLSGTMQTLIDHPEDAEAIGELLSKLPYFKDNFLYNSESNWTQNSPGEPSVISVWGYLLNPDGTIRPDVSKLVGESAILDLLGPPILNHGSDKLQVYYMGPKEMPIMRLTPYVPMAQNFDRYSSGHNQKNFWDFFFPGVYEGWQKWIKQPDSRVVKRNFVTVTNPYVDAVTNKEIITFFHPLWNKERTDASGAVAIDITLDQVHKLIGDVEFFDTGFAFLMQSNGNVIAIQDEDAKTLGLTIHNEASQGVIGLDRNISNSSQPSLRDLKFPESLRPEPEVIKLLQNGVEKPYWLLTKQLPLCNFWNEKTGITSESWVLAFMVPTEEIYKPLIAAKATMERTSERTISFGFLIGAICLVFTLIGVMIVSRRMTTGIVSLASAADRMKNKDYSARVPVSSKDEIGRLGEAFNSMSDEIERYTSDLEGIVEERTADLAAAKARIEKLNGQLKEENVRMGAELDVARQLQMMVLPKAAELQEVPGFDISAYMSPADEVGGDYYDVLQFENLIKFGIGDVTGHGLESGVVMLMVQSVARALLESGEYNPVNFLARLNKILCRNMHRIDSDKSLTLSFIDYTENKLTLSGQHEEVIVLRKSGAVERIDTIDLGFPIGIEEDITPFIATRDIPLSLGETVALYTDGITEAEDSDGHFFGIERLCDSLARHQNESAQAMKEAVIRDLRTFIGGQKVFDDISLLILKKTT